MIRPSYEPRVLVLGGNSTKWSARDMPHMKNTMNGIEAWAFTFWGDYCGYKNAKDTDIANYDIIIANTNFDRFPEYLRLRDKVSHNALWIALIEGSGSDYIRPNPTLKKVLDAADIINCINKYTLSLLRSITTTRVEYLGIPYPAETIRELSVPIHERRREVLLCQPLTSRWNDYYVARALGIEYYGFEHLLSRKLKLLWHNFKKYRSFVNKNAGFDKVRRLYNDPTIRIEPVTNLSRVFDITSKSLIWLNLDDRYTWGRNVLDAAALQIPIISTRSTGHAEDFFPATMVVDEFDIDGAISLGKRLLSDEEFYRSVVDIPLEKFDHLSHETMKKTLLSWL
ncbi:MAG: glycosyltransferase family 1 protein [Ignavibacteria bacterium]|nr:glycosyltransferase family 1 protein [Ignavibacteria bacterium]